MNKFLVGLRSEQIVVGMLKRPSMPRRRTSLVPDEVLVLSPDDALNLAAWLVAVGEPYAKRKFSELLKEVQAS